MLEWLGHRTVGEAAVVFVLANAAIFLGSVALCAILGRAFARRRLFRGWEPLRQVEIAAAIGSIFFNSVVSVLGWMLWKQGIILLPEKPVWAWLSDAVFMLLAMDLGMYALHRLAHLRRIYPLFHTFHHRHEKTNPISLFVLHPFEVLGFGGLMIAFLVLFPISAEGLTIYLILNVLWGTLGHSGVEPFPAAFARWPGLRLLGTSTFHAEHHETPGYNFGFYTLIWDRLFGTIHPDYFRHFRKVSGSH